jgi:metal-dependent amidase/aminoacylase/carboxypeptidase family protein
VGHACGHNIICAASLGAAIGTAAIADAAGLTVTVLGTPGEELFGLRELPPGANGPGKAVLLESGAFDGVHAAMMVHPAPVDLAAAASRAVTRIQARFRAADAANAGFLASPRALLAADQAGTLCDIAAGLLHTSAPAGLTVHRVQSAGCWDQHPEALIDFAVRGDTLDDAQDAAGRLADCARSAAAATGCHATVERFLPYAQMRHDPDLTACYQANAQARGREFPDLGPIADQIGYATDMGTVSHQLPAIHPFIGIETTAMNHQPEFAAACIGPSADRALIDGAVALAWTALDAATRPELRHRLLTRDGPGLTGQESS